jgi:hypothetical protein
MARFLLLVLLAFLVTIASTNVLAIVRGRSGSTFAHKLMVASGTIGLLSLLAMAVSAYFLGAMLMVATLHSVQGAAFIVSACVCAFFSLVSSALCLVGARSVARYTVKRTAAVNPR